MKTPTKLQINSEQPLLSGSAEEGSPKKGNLALEHIRPELNIEKWAALWRPAHSPKVSSARVLEREHAIAKGNRVRARVEVGFTHLGELTTEDQRTYYALVKQWEISGQSAAQTFFSIRGLAKFLHKKWGTNVITAVTTSLRRLRATPITWENSYFDASRRETLEEINTFNILSELKIVRKKVDGHVTKEAGYYRFNDFTLGNLLNGNTKPVLFETILRFKTDLAQLLYTHLDLIMADKRVYERRTRELCGDLGLRGTEYNRLYERKRAFAKAIAELRGVMMTTGVIVSIVIGKTKDGKDYKLTVQKGSNLFKQAEIRQPAKNEVPAMPLPTTKSDVFAEQARELVCHFHKLFHDAKPAYFQSKEIAHAATLAAQYGFERAKYVVDYAHIAAAQTRYTPQTFGGILQYSTRAVAAFDENLRKKEVAARGHKEAKEREKYEALQAEVLVKRRREAEQRLASLPHDQFEALAAKVKNRFLTQSDWLKGKEDSALFQKMVRARMVTELLQQMGESG